MTKPNYVGMQRDQIPVTNTDNDKVTIYAVSGNWNGTQGAFKPLSDIHLARIDFKEGGKFNITIPPDKNVFLYIVRGEVIVNGDHAHEHHIVEFNHDGQMIELKSTTDAIILLGYASPFKEPFMAYGPFVMNTREEIMKAYEEYHAGAFGKEEF
jgi:redox-sensitive bicupin YhaK (pirin superfamily)